MNVSIKAIASHLPVKTLNNDELVVGQDAWSPEKIFAKTGIASRAIASPDETATDLACEAAEHLLKANSFKRDEIELLVFCTQSPDYVLPTSSCILQNRLALSSTVAAFDFNLGCSGYVYGLSIVKSMMESNGFKKALLLTGDTYTKYLEPDDRSTRSIFGDGASATLLEMSDSPQPCIGPFVFGTDGSGYDKLIVPNSGCSRHVPSRVTDDGRTDGHLFMAGADIFTFTLKTVPAAVKQLLDRTQETTDTIDWFVFHQANAFMLEHLRRRCKIPKEKFIIDVGETGNTVSTSIPLALHRMSSRGELKTGQKIALIGFGVGYSWAGCLITWS